MDEIAPVGRHYCQLLPVEVDRIDSKYPDDVGDGKAGIWIWKFRSKTKNEETGAPETLRKMTPDKLTPNNGTMKFWKQLQPGMTFEDCDGNTEALEGRWFEAEVVHEAKGDKTYANIAFIKPYVKPAQVAKNAPPVPTDDEVENADPFASEV